MQMDETKIMKELAEIKQLALLGSKNVLDIHEAAILLNLSVQSVRSKVRNREFPAYRPNPNRLYFKKEELEAWMLQNRQMSQDEMEHEAARYCLKHKK